MEISQQASNFN